MVNASATSSYVVALILSVGALVFYFFIAIRLSRAARPAADQEADFNLGVPDSGGPDRLFAITLVAAGTSLSTVFVFFLTAGSFYGWWLLLCPLLFAAGNGVTYLVYKKVEARGYFNEGPVGPLGGSGLLPFLGQRLSGRTSVGWALMLLSMINLLAVFVLELIVGVEVISYLVTHALAVQVSSLAEFLLFAVSIGLMLGYVFVGGFRAVVASDVWQMKAMAWAVAIALVSCTALAFSDPTSAWQMGRFASQMDQTTLLTFVLNIFLGNLLIPLSQEATWQRFRAFRGSGAEALRRGMTSALWRSVALWGGLIVLAFLLLTAPASTAVNLGSMSAVLDYIRGRSGLWFPFVVFPLLAAAALSAMYSTADTCVSCLLYISGYRRYAGAGGTSGNPGLGWRYYLVMGLIFVVSLLVYFVVRLWLHPTILQLIFSVFSNLVVVAPSVLSMALLPPCAPGENSGRAPSLLFSLIVGSVVFWGCIIASFIQGSAYLWLSQMALTIGLIAAVMPLLPLWLRAFRAKGKSPAT